MNQRRNVAMLAAGVLLSLLFSFAHAQQQGGGKPAISGNGPEQLIGVWEVFRTKEPGKPYKNSYKGRPFVSKGADAFLLILEYRKDGTYRRISRVGENETVQQGEWRLSGHELRLKGKGQESEEVMHVRFDNPDQYTTIEVYEGSPDPGLFAQFKRVK